MFTAPNACASPSSELRYGIMSSLKGMVTLKPSYSQNSASAREENSSGAMDMFAYSISLPNLFAIKVCIEGLDDLETSLPITASLSFFIAFHL